MDQFVTNSEKVAFSARCSSGGKMFLRGGSRVRRLARRGIRRIARISGCLEFVVY